MKGSQTEERVLAEGGGMARGRGMEGVERLRKREGEANGEDMMVHKSPVAD